MKTAHCIFDATILVDCDVYGQRAEKIEKGHYIGPRLIACTHYVDCSKCGWNPLVEERRKAKELRARRGYINCNGETVDTGYVYKGIKV